MANRPLDSQVIAGFRPSGDGAHLVWEEDEDKESDDIRVVYMRLYPAIVPVVFTTSGSLTYQGKRTEKDKETVVVFDGDNKASAPYPEIYNVKLTRIGGFYDKTGAVIPGVEIKFNANKNLVEASHEGFGVVEVEYDVNYRLYKFKFDGPGCPIDPFDVVDPEYEPFDKAVLVAIDGAKEAIATYSPDIPKCETKELRVNLQPGAATPRIDLIIDPEYPPSLGPDIGVHSVINCGCRVRHIPKVPSTVKTNTGNIREVDEGIGTLYQEVNEMLLFSGSSSVNLSYQSHSKPLMLRHGRYRNKWGSRVIPNFRGAGESVFEVERPNETTKRNPRRRVVGNDEVVSVDDWGNTLEIFGVVEVTYKYSYRLFELEFSYNDTLDVFNQAYVTAFRQGTGDNPDEPADLRVDPPSMKGAT